MTNKKVIVIGAGLGGLTAAIKAAKAGCEVVVYEKNNVPGGKAGTVEVDGFRFDSGPTLLTMPFVIKKLFEDCGKNIEEYLKLKPLDQSCKYFYPDGTIINAYSDTAKFAAEIEKKTHDKAEDVYRFLNYSRDIYDLTSDLFLFSQFRGVKSFLNGKALKTLFNLRKIDTSRSMDEAIRSFFKDGRVVQLFNRYATYNGSNPYEAPATLNIIPHVEHNLGAFVPEGGIKSIPEALYKLALELGVSFHFNSVVERIYYKNKKIFSVHVNKHDQFCNAVICNSDVFYAYRNMINLPGSRQKKVHDDDFSSSALVFYWGVKGKHDELGVHNILFSENYYQEFVDIFDRKMTPLDPTTYIYISSKYNSGDAPAGYENWYVMVNAPFNYNQPWKREAEEIKEEILLKIERMLKVSLREKIVSERILTPDLLEEQTFSFRGSLYGMSSNGRYNAFLRQRNRSKEVKGLYFCGGSAHPGGGMPLVVLSGMHAAEALKEDFTKGLI